MFLKKLDEINESDLDNLYANSVSEGKTIEYKQSLPTNADADKKEFLADVSSFANAAGGDLIFGITEAQGAPTGTPGLTLVDADAEIRRLDSIIADGLEPRVKSAVRVIQREGALPVLIVRTERSWIGPHRVTFKGHDKFYARNSGGKYPMDVSELRSAFNLTDTVTERVRQFRTERIQGVQSGRFPVRMVGGLSKTILHAIPLGSFSGPTNYDVVKYSPVKLRPLVPGSGSGTRINLDGVVTFSAGAPSMSYTQLFRNGAVETVEVYWLNIVTQHGAGRRIPHLEMEEGILRYLGEVFSIQKDLGVTPPIVVALTLTATNGLRMASRRVPLVPTLQPDDGYQILEDDLVLPEAIVQDFSEAPEKILKPIFDMIWNACGFEESKNFDENGAWSPSRF